MRKLAGVVLALWVLSFGGVLLHSHHVPVIALSKPETVEARQDVCAWISPWIAIVPEEVFFDRPLARGPPSLS